MRSAALILATLLLLGGALFVYFKFQPDAPTRRATTGPVIAPGERATTRGGAGAVLGAGSDVWVRYDKRTGELASQFRAAKADPQPDGTVLVDKPQAEFMLDEGRVLRIAGDRGSVIMPPPEVDQGDITNTRVERQAPNRGHLYDVVISLFASLADADAATPMLTVEMNNAAFDNDTFRISTESYTDAAGATVAADEVPIKVRGDDYDFDGRGLTIRWDQVGRRLQLLEIAHGEAFTLKNPDAMMLAAKEDGEKGDVTLVSQTSGDETTRAERRQRRARRAGATTTTTMPATTQAAAEPAYRATFEKDIRILRGGVEAVAGDAMIVDFLLEPPGDDKDDASATQPSTAPATTRASKRPRRSGETTPAEATKPPEGPVVIRWSGKLRVTPLEDEAPSDALEPGGAIVRITGAPVRLAHDGASAESGTLGYATAGERVTLEASDAVPLVTMAHPDGWSFTTKQLDYGQEDESVVLRGQSRADIPDPDGGASDARLVASWNDVGTFRLVKDAAGATSIENADLHGGVEVTHPRFDMTGGNLNLTFAPASQPATQPAATQPTTQATTAQLATTLPTTAPTTKPASTRPSIEPRRLVATGGVKATIKDPNRPPQSIAAQTLEIDTATTADGTIYPRTIKADGEVVASSDEESMRAGHLLAHLRPATRPTNDDAKDDAKDDAEIEIESLVAHPDVQLTGPGGASGRADRISVESRDGQRVAELTGGPAKLSDGKNTLAGPIVRLFPDGGRGEVVGAGTLHAEHAPDATGPSTPIDLAWAGGANFDAPDNLVRFRDEIVLVTTDADGTRTEAKSSELRMTLADAPATQPATAPTSAPTSRPAKSRGGLALGGDDFMPDKVPKSAALVGDVRVESILAGPAGEVLRWMFLEAPEAHYDVAGERLDVPTAGRMLFEDHRPPDPNKKEKTDARGATAFAWKKSLAYDGKARLATMDGGVEINHDPDGEREPFRISTDRVRAELEPHATTEPTTAPTSAPPTNEAATKPAGLRHDDVRARRLTADGGVRVETAHFRFAATDLTYDPAEGVVVARGTERDPITFTDDRGGSEGAVQELRWNIKTDEIKLTKFRASVR